MGHEHLISMMRSRRGPEAATLDEYFEQAGVSAWGRLRDVARGNPNHVADDVIEWATRRLAECPPAYFALLLDVAFKAQDRRPGMIDLFRRLMPDHPKGALAAAGYNLHEYNKLLDRDWIEAARAHFDHDPEGAWGIFESAAMYRPEFVRPEDVDWFEARRASMPRDYVVTLLSLAVHWPDRAGDYVARVVRAFPEDPAAAVDGTTASARDEAPLLQPDLIAAMLRHFRAAPEKGWEFFTGACRARPEIFDDALLDALSALPGPGGLFTILGRLIEVRPDRVSGLLDRYAALVRRHPAEGIASIQYGFQQEMKLVRRDLVKAVCEGFAAAPYAGYEFLRRLAQDRPERIGPPEVDTALRNIGNATNYAFGFFQELLKLRPEFTRECTLALFECLAQEPVHRAFMRADEMTAIIAISEAAHIRTGLEGALREPPAVGSRRARALMAIMFRQKLRARRHVLLEALRYAATVVLWRDVPGGESEKYSPIWDFLMFIIDNASEDAVSTAAAERFLEGSFQLRYLCRTGAEHDAFFLKLDLGHPPAQPFPSGARFLEADADLAHLHRLVLELGKRFGAEPRIAPLKEFAGRLEAAETELREIRVRIDSAEGERRDRLRERERSLALRLEARRHPEYARAFDDAEAEQRLPEPARALVRREKKDLAKNLRDALRAEAIRIAVAAVESSRLALYRNRLEEVFGREVDPGRIEPRILPAFLWFQAIGHLENNTRYLKRLIEDRIAGRPHDWLRTEPPVLTWAEEVRKGQPEIRLERWRAPFEKEIQYRPKDALAEKRRRIKADLAQARALLERQGAAGLASDAYDELAAKLAEIRNPTVETKEEGEPPPPRRAPDPAALEEIEMNLERVRLAEQTPDSDFEGTIRLSVETDPFEILFMGEYGFASCLSLRGSNAWSAVSNAIDIDKAIVWAKEPGGNVVGRRLLALTPQGVLTFRTYTNRHGLALDRAFDEFVNAYAAHCGTRVTRAGQAGPLLSDRWYDDGAI